MSDKLHVTEALVKVPQSLFEMVAEFHKKFGLEYNGQPRFLGPQLQEFRLKRTEEEHHEYILAGFEEDLAGQLDALVDLVYIVLGTAYLHGFDFDEAFHRVHKANMAKVRATSASQSKHGTTLDIVKPEGWTAPDLSDLVRAK